MRAFSSNSTRFFSSNHPAKRDSINATRLNNPDSPRTQSNGPEVKRRPHFRSHIAHPQWAPME